MRTILTLIGFGVFVLSHAHAADKRSASMNTAARPEAFLDRKVDEQPQEQGGSTKWDAMEVGPFLTSGFAGPHPACKNISIKVGKTNAVAFDTELLRMTMGWTGGFLKLPKLRGGIEGFPKPEGTPVFWTPTAAGWSKGDDFSDPRPTFTRFDYKMNDAKYAAFPKEVVYGHLPNEWGHYKGVYLDGDRTILSYTVGKRSVLETPAFESVNGLPVFSRTFDIDGPAATMGLLMAEVRPIKEIKLGDKWIVVMNTNGTFTAVGFVNAPDKSKFEIEEGSVVLKLARGAKRQNFKVLISSGPETNWTRFAAVLMQESAPSELKPFCHGGPARWGQPLVAKGAIGKSDNAYAVDTLTVPESNPWNSWIRCSGFDFFSDGRAAVCSVSGDVWIVGGIDDKLEKVTWKRFATGLFQPLGLKIVKDKVYVTCRDGLLRLHDYNGDDEADFYENFNNDVTITPHYHEFCLNLETDSKGNFYFCKGSNLREAGIPHHGTLLKVSPDGRRCEVVCNGLRAPNGLGMGPHDEITIADNEGKWTPSSRVNLIKPGGFYGNVFTGFTQKPRTSYDDPLFWIPHNNNIDNSSGGQVWVTSDKWGPLKGHMLHTSYGTCSLFEVMQEQVDGTRQAAVVRLPLKFESGIMRGRFSPFDGQLYLCGLSVWQSNAAKEAAFHRVRYTGKPANVPVDFHVTSNGIAMTFSDPLDRVTAEDPQNYNVEVWNYHWTSEYGSKEYSVAHPNEAKRDSVDVKSAMLSPDKRTVTLQLAEVKPVMQMKVQYNIDAADGVQLKQEIYNSIFKIPSSQRKSMKPILATVPGAGATKAK